MPFILRSLLFPFAAIYDAVTRVRNRLYDQGMKPSTSFDIPIISVGNLAVGGTGKTPMIEYLIRLLQPHLPVATLSRGYGRKTNGVRIADAASNADTLGDEPFQVHRKFPRVTVAVGEDRVYAVPVLLDRVPETKVILLDDAFQHRRIKPSLQILLTEYAKPFYEDYLLPSGRLRESRKGAARADAVVVTKCPPSLSQNQATRSRKKISRYTRAPVFFSTIRYGQPIVFGGHDFPLRRKLVLVTGIANTEPLKAYLATEFEIVRHVDHADHYRYTMKDLEHLRTMLREDMVVMTTEKDMVKMDSLALAADYRLPLFYLPMEMALLEGGGEFDAMVLDRVGVTP